MSVRVTSRFAGLSPAIVPQTGLVCALLLALPAGGCNFHALTGDMLNEYSVEHVGPYLMESDDLLMACETGVSLGSQLLSYSRVTDAPDQAAISTMVSAASCAEEAAWEEQLRGMRALREGRAEAMQDARIAEKRAHAVAAQRYYRGYRHLVSAYGEPGASCPELETELDQLAWMLGMLAGANAVQHDRAAHGVVGVPMDIPIKVTRGMGCLDDDRWFGVPSALQAVVWMGLPGATPEGVDVFEQLAAASAKGEKKGVRLAQTLYAKGAESAGRTDLLRQVITAHAAAVEEVPRHSGFKLLDLTATRQILHMSDVLWTRATGHRTPWNALGTFWDSEDLEAPGDDRLLDDIDLDGDDTPTDTPETSP